MAIKQPILPLFLKRSIMSANGASVKSVAVVREKDLFVLDEMSDRYESFPDIAPRSSVHKRNAPVWGRFTQNLDLLAEIRDDAIARCRLLVAQEIVLDDVCLVSKAKNEIPMTVLAIVLHHMPQNRLVSDRHHRLWNALRVFANTGAQSPAEQNNFHDAGSRGSITSTLGIGTIILQPQAPTWRICATISFFKFHGKISK